jgi:alpha-N-acetylglucosaminidase
MGSSTVFRRIIVLSVLLVLSVLSTAHAGQLDAARGLLNRLIPEHAHRFLLETIDAQDGLDVFEIEATGGTVTLRGSSGVALASALNWYLREYAHCNVSLCGSQLNLPDPLPAVPEKVRIVTPFKYRYCFNFCCFSYSMAWWDWDQWERVIDWMALHGVTMPLAVTGQEATWQSVYRGFGLTDEEIGRFFVGPAFLPFGWMGCMDGWGGPLPQSWIDGHRELQERILARERELGMTPVLQGFTGHVPEALQRAFPDAKFEELPSWCGFPGTTFIDPADPLFLKIGTAFIEEQRRQYGTDHFYASDTFIEMSPPSNDPEFLATMGDAVYKAMATADPEAIWVMQGWLFVNNPNFWKPPQAKALLNSVSHDHMLVLDLWCEARPAWTITEAFHGKPWLWCIIQSFGNQVSLHGNLPRIAAGLSEAVVSPDRGRLSGAGFIMEGLGYNPVVYDLMGQMFWRPDQPNMEEWIAAYAHRRYGAQHPKAEEAWRILLGTAYQLSGQVGSIICGRPTTGQTAPHTGHGQPYPLSDIARAAQLLAECAPEFGQVDAYRYDLVHVTRQLLAGMAARRQQTLVAAYGANNREALAAAGNRYMALMNDMDELLGTRPEFLFGKWLSDAKGWATNEDERRLYEWNARTQITLWSPKDGALFDYASKQWSGLINGFYVPRWQQLIDTLDQSLADGVAFDRKAFDEHIRDWEEAWTHQAESFPDEPAGDSVAVAQRLLAAYVDEIDKPEAVSLATGKPATCSHALPPHPASRANDGFVSNTHSYWATDTNVDPACWWQVDLEEPTEVARVVLIFYYGDERDYEFFIETSRDGESWDLAADYRGNPQRTRPEGVAASFAPRTARHLRVTITHNSANTGRHLVEVLAYPAQKEE